jgi:hypothetical protein
MMWKTEKIEEEKKRMKRYNEFLLLTLWNKYK